MLGGEGEGDGAEEAGKGGEDLERSRGGVVAEGEDFARALHRDEREGVGDEKEIPRPGARQERARSGGERARGGVEVEGEKRSAAARSPL